jgi:hypothetical protein
MIITNNCCTNELASLGKHNRELIDRVGRPSCNSKGALETINLIIKVKDRGKGRGKIKLRRRQKDFIIY